LVETLQTLNAARIAHAGAGQNVVEVSAPVVFDVSGKGRALIFAVGSVSSGIPDEWSAMENRPGVCLLPDLSIESAQALCKELRRIKQAGDVGIASVHWGGNWGYEITASHIRFAHQLIDGGFDVVHGHSSHHAKAAEVYQDRLILYGCGDFLNDYEGIDKNNAFRSDLTLMYLVDFNPLGHLAETQLIPMQIRRLPSIGPRLPIQTGLPICSTNTASDSERKRGWRKTAALLFGAFDSGLSIARSHLDF